MSNNRINIYKALAMALTLIVSACTSTQAYKDIKQMEVTESIAGKYALYAMMASNSYHKEDRIYFPLEKLGWQRIASNGNTTNMPAADHPITGLAYDIYENQGSKDIVFAFRGTDSKWDYFMANLAAGISPAYKQAFKEFEEYKNSHPNKRIIVTGHSLGGGIALGVSVRFGVNAIVFDSSPRIFDGLGDHHADANRILIYQDKEVLEKIRKKWKKISEVVKEGNVYKSNYDFSGKSYHRGDLLAKALLEHGKGSNRELQVISDSL